LRMKVKNQPSFFFNCHCDQKVVKDYQTKYNAVDRLLEENPELLNITHKDLKEFGNSGGRESDYSSEQIMRMFLVKEIERETYRGLIIRVNDSDFLRNFVRIGVGRVMTISLLNAAFKNIKATTWKKVNGILVKTLAKAEKISGDRLRLDSTVSETNIHFPTDSSLLWDSYRTVARLVGACSAEDRRLNCGNRFHDKKIKRLHTFISTQGSRQSKSTKRKVAKNMKALVERVEAVYEVGQTYVSNALAIGITRGPIAVLIKELVDFLPLVKHVTVQARRSQINGETVPASERIFSIFEPHTELLKRGKAGKPVEFGHMVSIGQTEDKIISYYSVEEKSRHDIEHKTEALEGHKKIFEKYPDEFTADKNYYESMEDVEEWEKKINVFAIGKKGKRTEEQEAREHTPEFRDLQRFRAGCEGSISVLKRAFSLRRCLYRTFESFAASIGLMVLSHNLIQLAMR
jgi:transposase, IS5 family